MRLNRKAREDGAVIVEFAIVFVLFVTLLSGLIQYGAIFATQQSLSHAAAEGARAAVDVIEGGQAETRAEAAVADQLEWLDPAGVVAAANVSTCASPPYPADTECLVVETSYDWDGHAIVPSMLPLPQPETLTARAVIVRD